jgi:hypothetical protein
LNILPPHIRKALEREELKEAKKRKKQLKQLRQKESLKREDNLRQPPKEKIWYCLDDRTEYRETYDDYERHCEFCLLCSED